MPKQSNSVYFGSMLCLLVLAIFSISCAKKYQKGTIYMGSGGGFTGAWQEYQLNADGKLFMKNSRTDSVVYLRTLDSASTKKFFKRYHKLKIDDKQLDAPGNAYFYMGHKEGKFKNKKITFGASESPVSKEIQQLFNDFIYSIDHPGPILE
jgi:hypothetical protein